jgi:ribosome biogenesis GTPase A
VWRRQTIPIENDITLCDCPGLVFPSFVATKADMVVNGILPIDQMRTHHDPVQIVRLACLSGCVWLLWRAYVMRHFLFPQEIAEPSS